MVNTQRNRQPVQLIKRRCDLRKLSDAKNTWREKRNRETVWTIWAPGTVSQVKRSVLGAPRDSLVPLEQKDHVAGGDQRERRALQVPWDHQENPEKQEWRVLRDQEGKGVKGKLGPKGMPGPPGRPGKSMSAAQVMLSPAEQTRDEGANRTFYCTVGGNPSEWRFKSRKLV